MCKIAGLVDADMYLKHFPGVHGLKLMGGQALHSLCLFVRGRSVGRDMPHVLSDFHVWIALSGRVLLEENTHEACSCMGRLFGALSGFD